MTNHGDGRKRFRAHVEIVVGAFIIALVIIGFPLWVIYYAATYTSSETQESHTQSNDSQELLEYMANSERARQILQAPDPTKMTVMIRRVEFADDKTVMPLDAGTLRGQLSYGFSACALDIGAVLTKVGPDHQGRILVSYAPPGGFERWLSEIIVPYCKAGSVFFMTPEALHRLTDQ